MKEINLNLSFLFFKQILIDSNQPTNKTTTTTTNKKKSYKNKHEKLPTFNI